MSLLQEIREDFTNIYHKDPAIKTRFELFFNYPGVWAVAWYRVSNRIYKSRWHRVARFLMAISQFLTNIDIHPAATIGRRLFIDHGIGVVIGETAVIENDVLIYQGVTLGGVNLTAGVKRHPTIKEHAVIGAGAKILGDITIGRGAKVGSNSVVVKSVPDNSTAVGIPARVVEKGRSKDQLSHNKLPDIDKELFNYLLKRVAILEHILMKEDSDILEKDLELEQIYETFIKAMRS